MQCMCFCVCCVCLVCETNNNNNKRSNSNKPFNYKSAAYKTEWKYSRKKRCTSKITTTSIPLRTCTVVYSTTYCVSLLLDHLFKKKSNYFILPSFFIISCVCAWVLWSCFSVDTFFKNDLVKNTVTETKKKQRGFCTNKKKKTLIVDEKITNVNENIDVFVKVLKRR